MPMRGQIGCVQPGGTERPRNRRAASPV